MKLSKNNAAAYVCECLDNIAAIVNVLHITKDKNYYYLNGNATKRDAYKALYCIQQIVNLVNDIEIEDEKSSSN